MCAWIERLTTNFMLIYIYTDCWMFVVWNYTLHPTWGLIFNDNDRNVFSLGETTPIETYRTLMFMSNFDVWMCMMFFSVLVVAGADDIVNAKVYISRRENETIMPRPLNI